MTKIDYNQAFVKALQLQVDTLGKGNQSAIARKVGVNQQYISLILKGKRTASEKKRREIAEKLGYTYEEFLNLGDYNVTSQQETADTIARRELNTLLDKLDQDDIELIKKHIEIHLHCKQKFIKKAEVIMLNTRAKMHAYIDNITERDPRISKEKILADPEYQRLLKMLDAPATEKNQTNKNQK